jgi:hypothetical protein
MVMDPLCHAALSCNACACPYSLADHGEVSMKLQTCRTGKVGGDPPSMKCTPRGADCLASGAGNSSRALLSRQLGLFFVLIRSLKH